MTKILWKMYCVFNRDYAMLQDANAKNTACILHCFLIFFFERDVSLQTGASRPPKWISFPPQVTVVLSTSKGAESRH